MAINAQQPDIKPVRFRVCVDDLQIPPLGLTHDKKRELANLEDREAALDAREAAVEKKEAALLRLEHVQSELAIKLARVNAREADIDSEEAELQEQLLKTRQAEAEAVQARASALHAQYNHALEQARANRLAEQLVADVLEIKRTMQPHVSKGMDAEEKIAHKTQLEEDKELMQYEMMIFLTFVAVVLFMCVVCFYVVKKYT